MNNTPRVLLTAASNGLGLEVARTFAQHGHPLIITALDSEELAGVARELQEQHKVEVFPFACDFLQPEAAKDFSALLKTQNLSVEILVNHSCVGSKGEAKEHPLENYVKTSVTLTRQFLPEIQLQKQGRILNMASTGTLMNSRRNAIYHSVRGFVFSFSRALSLELKNSGVTVTAVCPPPAPADAVRRQNDPDPTGYQQRAIITPTEVAEAGYQALMKGEALYVPGSNQPRVASRRLRSDSASAKISEGFLSELRLEKSPKSV